MHAPGGCWGGGQQANCTDTCGGHAGEAATPGCGARERGSAVVDFVLVGGLLTAFFLAIIQLTLVIHVRNTLIDAAASGARYGTLADRNSEDARARTAQLIGVALNPEFAGEVTASESTYQGVRTLEVTVRAPLPVLGLIGPRALLEVKGHAAIQP
ncbi:MAG: pilus assembly protein TadE [Arthrobacter sp.]|nr:pilus assembly protein TadE [Arthrobacter sp.]